MIDIKILVFVASFFLFGFQLLAQQEWTYNEVLKNAETRSIFSYQAIANNKIAHGRFKLFESNLKPNVSLDVIAPNFIRTSQEIVQPDGSIFFRPISQNNSSISIGVQQQIKATGGTVFLQTQLQRFDDFSLDNNQYNGLPIRLGLVQSIFGFNELKWNDKIEPLYVQEADMQFIIDMEDTHILATAAYFDVLRAQVDATIAGSNKEVNEKLLTIANERFKLGKASKNDLLQLELEYKAATKDLSTAQYRLKFAQGGLTTFLGLAYESDFTLDTPLPLEENANTIDIDKAINLAVENRPEFIAFQRMKLEADRDVIKVQKDFGIQADLFAGVGLARGSQTLSEVYSDPIGEQQLQLSVSIPILDWGRRKQAVGQARAQQELVQQEIAQGRLGFKNEIIQLVNLWEQIQQEIKIQQEIQEVSLERFEISRQRYILGDISITDLTIAQREKDQSQRDFINSLESYWLTYYQIRKSTGYDFLKNEKITYTIEKY